MRATRERFEGIASYYFEANFRAEPGFQKLRKNCSENEEFGQLE